MESAPEQILEYLAKLTNARAITRKFLPFAGTLFLFLLLSNWLGQLPGTGSIGFWHISEAGKEFVPLLRPAASDLNLTLALAVLTIVSSHVVGVFSVGFFAHVGRFIQLGPLWKAVRSLKVIAILTAAVEFVVGLIELMTEFAKIASLALRLFGNIFAGEILMTVIASLLAAFAPLPFIALELVVGVVQALVFTMLALVYFTIFSQQPHGSEDEHASEGHDAHAASAHADLAPASGHG